MNVVRMIRSHNVGVILQPYIVAVIGLRLVYDQTVKNVLNTVRLKHIKTNEKRKNSYKNGYAILRTYTQHKKALTACKLPPS